jgi:hypothetical protein
MIGARSLSPIFVSINISTPTDRARDDVLWTSAEIRMKPPLARLIGSIQSVKRIVSPSGITPTISALTRGRPSIVSRRMPVTSRGLSGGDWRVIGFNSYGSWKMMSSTLKWTCDV